LPTYGYQCEKCGHTFEVSQRMTDPAGAGCPTCGAAARRLFYPTGIVFKGSGFYATDSRKASAESGSSSNSSGSSSSGKDGKDAKKASTPSTTPSTTPSSSEPAS
jgi:putative FmdB family regulatory protein